MAEFLDSCLVALREEMIRYDGNLPPERENLMKLLSQKRSQQLSSLKAKVMNIGHFMNNNLRFIVRYSQ